MRMKISFLKNICLILSFSVLLMSLSLFSFSGCASSNYYNEKNYTGEDWFDEGLVYLKNDYYTEAFQRFKKSAEHGYPDGAFAVGLFYYVGVNPVSKNYATAIAYFKRASNAGSEDANAYLARCYWNGEGVNVNRALAKDYARQAGAEGQELLSQMYRIEQAERENESSEFWEAFWGNFAIGFLDGFLRGLSE